LLSPQAPKIIWEGPKPVVTLKPFNWDKMPPTKIANTIFGEIKINEVTIFDEDQRIIQDLFCDVKNIKVEGTEDNINKKPKKK